MLVLSRKPEEKIFIGEGIIVTILKIHGDKVSIGIQADRDTHIFRAELLLDSDGKKREKFPKKACNSLKGVVDNACCSDNDEDSPSDDHEDESAEQSLEEHPSYHP